MFGAIVGTVGGSLINGLIGGGNSSGGGLMDTIGNLAGKLLDPLSLFSGDDQQSSSSEGMPEEMQEMMSMMSELLQEVKSLLSEFQNESDTEESTSESLYSINTGSGDDTVTIG